MLTGASIMCLALSMLCTSRCSQISPFKAQGTLYGILSIYPSRPILHPLTLLCALEEWPLTTASPGSLVLWQPMGNTGRRSQGGNAVGSGMYPPDTHLQDCYRLPACLLRRPGSPTYDSHSPNCFLPLHLLAKGHHPTLGWFTIACDSPLTLIT